MAVPQAAHATALPRHARWTRSGSRLDERDSSCFVTKLDLLYQAAVRLARAGSRLYSAVYPRGRHRNSRLVRRRRDKRNLPLAGLSSQQRALVDVARSERVHPVASAALPATASTASATMACLANGCRRTNSQSSGDPWWRSSLLRPPQPARSSGRSRALTAPSVHPVRNSAHQCNPTAQWAPGSHDLSGDLIKTGCHAASIAAASRHQRRTR